MKNKLLTGILAIMLVFTMTMIGCDFENNDPTEKTITITGITGKTGDASLFVWRLSDKENIAWDSVDSISGGSVTFTLLDWETDEPWTGSGSYGLILIFNIQDTNESTYVYKSGGNYEYNISEASSTIPFTLFDLLDDDTPGAFPGYAITGSGNNITAHFNGTLVQNAGGTQHINTVLNGIRAHANGAPVAIQFGNGTDTLDIGSIYRANFQNTAEQKWGAITFTGKITGSSTIGTILIDDGVTAISTADITNTGSSTSVSGVIVGGNNPDNSSLTINGGTITSQGTGQYAYTIRVWSRRAALTINNGTVRMIGESEGYAIGTDLGNTIIKGGVVEATSTGNGIRIMGNYEETFAVTIEGGIVRAVSGRALDIVNTGTANITGGEVSATSGTAVYLRSDGALNISGGTVKATTGVAIHRNSSGNNRPINLSGTAIVTSANVTADQGTIVLGGSTTSATGPRLIIGNGVTLNNTGGVVTVTTGDTVIRNLNNAAMISYVQDNRGTVTHDISSFIGTWESDTLLEYHNWFDEDRPYSFDIWINSEGETVVESPFLHWHFAPRAAIEGDTIVISLLGDDGYEEHSWYKIEGDTLIRTVVEDGIETSHIFTKKEE